MKEIEMFRSVNVISESVENVYYYFCRVIPMHPNLREWVSQKNDSANGGVKIVGNAGDMLLSILIKLPDPDQLLNDYNKLVYAIDNNQFAQKLRPIYDYANEIKESAFELRLSAMRTADFSNKEQQDKTISLLERFRKTFSDIYNDCEYWAESCSTLPAAAATGNKEAATPTEDPQQTGGTLPEIPNGEKFKKMMKLFVGAGFATELENDPNGCLWKWDEDNKGLLDFVCGRFFCGDKVKNGKLVFGSGRMQRRKVAPYFSNIDTKNLGNQRNQWKSEQAKDQYGFSVLLPSGWEEAEAIITQFIKT